MPQDGRETAGARSTDLTVTDGFVRALPQHAVIVVRTPGDQTDDVFASLAMRLAMLRRDDVTVIALEPGGELDVLDEDAMREQGWVRA